jgi:hypothetical protein
VCTGGCAAALPAAAVASGTGGLAFTGVFGAAGAAAAGAARATWAAADVTGLTGARVVVAVDMIGRERERERERVRMNVCHTMAHEQHHMRSCTHDRFFSRVSFIVSCERALTFARRGRLNCEKVSWPKKVNRSRVSVP